MTRLPHRTTKTRPASWNLSHLFRSDDDPRIEENQNIVERKSRAFITKWKDRTDYLRDPSVLKEALDDYEAWAREYGTDGDVGYYFMLRTQQERNNPVLKAKFNKIEDFGRKIQNNIQFFRLRIARIPKGRQRSFLDARQLREYRHFLERIFAESRYLLSEPEEKVLNLTAATSYANWVRMTSGFLAKEERVVLREDGVKRPTNFSEITSLLNSSRKNVRDVAAKAFNDILRSHVDAAEEEINSVLAYKKVEDELRGLERPDTGRHVSDDIDSAIVDTLIGAVSDRYRLSSEYYTLKAKLFGVKRLKYHERNVEYGPVTRKFSFPSSAKLIGRVLGTLDPEFSEIMSRFIEGGHLDIYPRKGKTSGAFCAHHLLTQPTYILLNHTGRLEDVLTFAHELGHGINNELMKQKQHALHFESPLSTAEVASTFMEDFVLQELLKGATPEERLSIMMKKLNDDVSTIFRQAACYRFEQELHHAFRQKGYLSKEEIGTIFQNHMAAYMGDSVEQSPGSENWWVYWSHIRSFFYVYSYASGLLISKSLQRSVKEDPRFIGNVKEFLSAGSSESPEKIFKGLGITISERAFWEKGLDEVESLLHEAKALARKLGKMK